MRRILAAMAVTMMFSGAAAAGEPVKLSDSKLDAVTAGAVITPILLASPTTFFLLTGFGGTLLGFSPFGTTSGNGSANVTTSSGPGFSSVTATVQSGH